MSVRHYLNISYARYLLHIDEIKQSMRIIDQVLHEMPDGPVMAKLPRLLRIPPNRAFAALESPRGQYATYVVSDGSDDGTDEIVRGIGDPRVTLVRQEPRAGKTSALNLGMPRATGEIMAYLNSDDLYLPGALWIVGEAFARDADLRWLCGPIVKFGGDRTPELLACIGAQTGDITSIMKGK